MLAHYVSSGVDEFAREKLSALRRTSPTPWPTSTRPPRSGERSPRFNVISTKGTSPAPPAASDRLAVLSWNQVLLYPAGRRADAVLFRPSVVLPRGWQAGTALEETGRDGERIDFAPLDLATLVDSPVVAGLHVATIDLPDVLVDQEVEVIHDELRSSLARQGIAEDAYLKVVDKTEADLHAEFRPNAEKRVRVLLTLSKIAEAEGISVSDADVQAEIDRAKERYGRDPKVMRYFDSERGRTYIRSSLRRSRVVEKLVEDLRAIDLNDYAVGIGVTTTSNPYVDGDDSVTPYPYLTKLVPSALDDGVTFSRNGAYGVRWLSNNGFEIGALAKLQTLGYEATDSPMFAGLADRAWTVEVGPSFGWRGPVHVDWTAFVDLLRNQRGSNHVLRFSVPRAYPRGYLIRK